MKEKFKVQVDQKNSIPIIFLKGEISTFSDVAINKSYKSISFKNEPQLIIDFTETTYINSAGIATLVGLVAEIDQKGGTLKFVGMAPHYQRVAKIVGITEYVKLYNSIEEALAEI